MLRTFPVLNRQRRPSDRTVAHLDYGFGLLGGQGGGRVPTCHEMATFHSL